MKQISFLILAALLGAVQANAGSIPTDPDLDSTVLVMNGTPNTKTVYLWEGNTLNAWESYSRNSQTNDWRLGTKMVYEYENGRLKGSLVYNWSTTQNAYVEDPSWKTEYYYNAQGKEWYNVSYNWDTSQKDWEAEPSTRTEYQYDETGKLVFAYYSPPGATVPTSKYEYQYDTQGYKTKEISYKLTNDNTWAKSSEYIYQNNSEGKATSYETYSGQIFGPTTIGMVPIPAFSYWGLYGRTTNEYDASGRIKRIGFEKIIYEVTGINTVRDTGRKDTQSNTYYYRNESSALTLPASNAVTVYSDPAANRLTLTGLQGNETLRIYSISGNLLLSDTATGETTTIDIAHLPAGIYLVGIQGDKGVSTHKFIKQ
jgi:hypothetical protein